MNRVFPFVGVDGAKEAIELYKEAFHAEVVGKITTYGDFAPAKADPELIAHCALKIFGSPLFIGDAVDQPYKEQSRVNVTVEIPTLDMVKSSFEVLQEEASNVFYKPRDVGWSELGYCVRDKYGIIWMAYYRE